MATPAEAVRTELAVVTTAASTDIQQAVAPVAPKSRISTALDLLLLIVPSYYDAAGSLATAWYGERRDESTPATSYAPTIIGDPTTDWIEREVAKFQASLESVEFEADVQRTLDEINRLAEKEVARGFRDTITGNSRQDEDAIGWSRVVRDGACKFCVMLADKGAVYREDTASFAAHGNCHCAARPEFRGGEHGPEASVMQYLASSKRAKDPRVQEARNARIRDYLNAHYPDSPG